ncbi:endonuclease/exonuclease/phosphatase family protein [Naasia aerilata]|uniref:endonuclease/exonuclease/phosphatase family protein n=1 Tax=Naasia aerilata TaxID=1162966 RepID=UPI00257387EF|nr:endonuclease/exonuclease/phosphatase family protein [Naasia aerilata]
MTTVVRVLTWNVWWQFGPQWRERQPLLLEAIRESGADIVALEESWSRAHGSQASEFAAALGFAGVFAAQSLPPLPDVPEHPEQAEVDLGLGLLSRWPITSTRVVPLPARHRPEAPVSLVAEIAHPDGPLNVIVTCLEWEPAFNDDRIAQSRLVADLATSPALDGSAPVIVLGDLNAAPDSAILRPLRDVLTDAWTAGGGDPNAVSLPSDHPQAPLEAEELIDRRIDHVLYRLGRPGQRVTVTDPALVGDPVEGLHPSDHRGVACTLAWQNRD